MDSAAYYSGNDIGFGGSASGTSTVGIYDEFCSQLISLNQLN